MRLGTRQKCVGSSPRVSGVCQDSAREFARRRPRLTGRLSRVAERLVGSWEDLVMDLWPLSAFDPPRPTGEWPVLGFFG
ncbi:hypothetical protein B296_00050922 [Ensete ventricosum]|uniref:Uncharacterized protein n=1 Tax=Ensete ventricosum TaxID=4639 RepID=A0A426YJB7_ENSVE|nr:hypothetical protein B296_00050922 [Ensete ventricosum]